MQSMALGFYPRQSVRTWQVLASVESLGFLQTLAGGRQLAKHAQALGLTNRLLEGPAIHPAGRGMEWGGLARKRKPNEPRGRSQLSSLL